MRKVLFALLAELPISAALTIWGIRMLIRAENRIPLFGELPLEGLTPDIFGLLLTLASAATFVVGIWRLIPLVRHLWLGKTLAEGGVSVRGVITDLQNCRVIRVNNTYSMRMTILCTTPSGRKLEFKSPVVWAPEAQSGDPVDVIFDPVDEERYCIRLVEKKFVRDSLKDKGKRRFL